MFSCALLMTSKPPYAVFINNCIFKEAFCQPSQPGNPKHFTISKLLSPYTFHYNSRSVKHRPLELSVDVS